MGSRFLALSRWVLIVALLLVGLSGETCNAKDNSTKCTSSCGNIHNISYPFRLKHDPKHCGNVMYTLSCENNITLVVDLPPSGKYYVQAINYHNQTIRLVDPGLQNNNCSSMPQNFPPFLRDPYSAYNMSGYLLSTPVFYIKCSNPVNSSMYVDTAPCLHINASLVQQKTYSYVKVGSMEVGDLNEGCSAEWVTLALFNYSKGYSTSYESIHSALMYGFELGVGGPDEICQGHHGV
ncbi:unnamed protein product [Prunus armeniaca]|uniref:Wall-associated receptor kinase galacturonan-binding domain-containing protein n=1 Tax=Prunus armeniaca TaxID=36596 RepID=A0A6J5TY21_PRUAR|nr:unnamed protein product [Prunus armeniaca]